MTAPISNIEPGDGVALTPTQGRGTYKLTAAGTGGVQSMTAGAGIIVNQPTGHVSVTAIVSPDIQIWDTPWTLDTVPGFDPNALFVAPVAGLYRLRMAIRMTCNDNSRVYQGIAPQAVSGTPTLIMSRGYILTDAPLDSTYNLAAQTWVSHGNSGSPDVYIVTTSVWDCQAGDSISYQASENLGTGSNVVRTYVSIEAVLVSTFNP